MPEKPTYEELEQRVKELEGKAVVLERSNELSIESEKKYRNIFNNAQIGLFRSRISDGKILECNDRFAQIVGYQNREECISDFVASQHYADPGTRERMVALIKENGEIQNFEARATRSDGSMIWVLYSGFLNYEKGYIEGVLADITEHKQAEEALRESEERYRSLFKNNHSVMLLIDPENADIVDANPAAISYYGWSYEELTSKKITNINTLTEKQVFQEMEKAKKEHRRHFYFQHRLADRNIRDVEVYSGPIQLQGRQLLYSIIHDITDRNQVEKALRESEEKLRNIIEHSNEIFYIHDTEHILTYVSSTSKDIFGYTPEEMMRNWTELITDNPINQKGFELTQKAIDTGERQEAYLLEAKKKDGTLFLLEIEESPVKDAEGKVAGIIGAGRDVTNRRQAEEALRKSEEKYRELIEDINDVIFSVDINGVITYISPVIESVLGYHPSEVIGKNFIEFIHPEDLDFVMERFEQVISGELEPSEYRLIEKSGRPRWVRSSSRPNYEEGSILGIRGVLIDISERKRLEAQLQQVQKMEAIGTLAGGVAHDFNNLMMGMLGNVSLVLHDLEPSHPHYEMLKHVDGLIQSGSRLTRQLLGFARKGKYEVKPVSLKKIVKESSETFGRTRKEITIKHELAEELFAVEADEAQIQQVLLNLYINASDAMPGGGNLFLQTLNVTHAELKDKQYDPKPGNYVMIKVADQGAGMDEKTMERIFDPFFTTKEMGRGTGLGLASAYGIIKGHGGYIDVDSKEGHGTTFSIYLPASDEKITETPPVSERFEKGIETILLVDDEEMVLDVGVKMLETMGYVVLEAKSGQEAIDVYKQNQEQIDLVILDMIMPGMGGGEAFDKMKEINPKVNVLLFSGYSIEGRAQDIMDRGCKGFIQKPFSLEDLSQKIREILGQD
jgi:PAS domain S-box-containing protein